MELRQEQAEDWWDVEALFDLAFAPGREALSSYRLRDGVDPVADLCLVACDEDGTIGELFIDMHKEGAAFRSLMNCIAFF